MGRSHKPRIEYFDITNLRVCNKCELPKLLSEFYSGKTYCKICSNLMTRTYHAANRKERNRKSRQYNKEHRQQCREAANRRNHQLRLECLQHYSGQIPFCVCCGDNHLEFLAIDHINGGGNKHRHSIGYPTGSKFYWWLKKNSWPRDFRVLCHNCNSSMGFYKYCPHNR